MTVMLLLLFVVDRLRWVQHEIKVEMYGASFLFGLLTQLAVVVLITLGSWVRNPHYSIVLVCTKLSSYFVRLAKPTKILLMVS